MPSIVMKYGIFNENAEWLAKSEKIPHTRYILKNHQCPGEILMLSACVRDIKLWNPHFELDVRTSCDVVFDNNPYITKLAEGDPSVRVLDMQYGIVHESNQNMHQHFIHGFIRDFNEQTGCSIKLTQFKPDLHLTKNEKETPVFKEQPEKFVLLNAGGKTDYKTKWWWTSAWEDVVNNCPNIQFIQVGKPDKKDTGAGQAIHEELKSPNVLHKINQTSFRELIRLCYQSVGTLSVVTSIMHIAAGFDRRACVTDNTLVTTVNGLYSVSQLVGVPFIALVNGQMAIAPKGFWSSGVKPTIRIKFSSRREITLTSDHRLFTKSGWKCAGEIGPGEIVCLHNHREFSGKVDTGSCEYARGYLLGNYIGDGTTSRRSAQVAWFHDNCNEYLKDGLSLLSQAGWSLGRKYSAKPNKKMAVFYSMELLALAKEKGCLIDGHKLLSLTAVTGNWSYLSGLIAGYIDADGSVTLTGNHGKTIRLASKDLGNLQSIQLALASFGIISRIYIGRKGSYRSMGKTLNPGRKYNIKTQYTLCIAGNNIERFAQFIELRNTKKHTRIKNIISTRQKTPKDATFEDSVMSVEPNGEHPVYDCFVPGLNAFDANTLYAHNCVMAGGHEPWWWEKYPGHNYFHTIGSLECCGLGGCWKKECENKNERDHQKCMEMIDPKVVAAAIRSWF